MVVVATIRKAEGQLLLLSPPSFVVGTAVVALAVENFAASCPLLLRRIGAFCNGSTLYNCMRNGSWEVSTRKQRPQQQQ